MKLILCWILSLALILTGVLGPPLKAQESGGVPVFDLGEIVVTGTHAPVKLSELPVEGSVITRKEIDNIKPKDIAELLSGAAGCEVETSGGLGQLATPRLRGSFGNQVLVLLDGMPLNVPNLGTADLAEIPVGIIDRLEIVRGPFSSAYGSWAMDGVINIITRKPETGMDCAVTLEGGSWATLKSLARLNFGSPKTSLLFIPGYDSTDGARPNSAYRSGNYFANFKQALGAAELGLSLQSQNSSLGLPGVKPAADYAERNLTQQLLGNSEISAPNDYSLSSNFKSNLSFSAKNFKLNLFSQIWKPAYHFARLDFSGNLQLEDDQAKTQVGGLNALYRFDSKTGSLTLGGELEQDYFDYASLVNTAGSLPQTTAYCANRFMSGYYLDYLLKCRPLVINIGLRYDRPSDFPAQLSPKLALRYQMAPELALKASAGSAYRAPTLNDLYWPQDAFSRGNPNLVPERSQSLEVSLEKLWGEKVLLKAGYFSESLKDMIDWAPTGPMGMMGNLWQPDNLKQVHKNGWEAEVKARLSKQLSLSANYSGFSGEQESYELADYITNALVQRTRPEANLPRYLLNLACDARLGDGWKLNLTGRFTGAKQEYYALYGTYPDTGVTMQAKELNAYSLFDVRLAKELKLAGRPAELFLTINNIFDDQYAVAFGNTLTDLNYPMPGRAIYLGAEIKL